MSIDLSKLSPAPWRFVPGMVVGGNQVASLGCEMGIFCAPDAATHPWTDAEFIALARNAFDVMMRRGWYAEPDSEKWFVHGECSGPLMEMGEVVWSDPFTALVEADKWYAQRCEGKNG